MLSINWYEFYIRFCTDQHFLHVCAFISTGNFEDEPQSCIRVLESAVKSCLKQNKIDVPDVMTAFEPFNDDTSRVLCE